jgi:hypothetical protein
LFVVVIEIQEPEFLLRTILRRGVNFALDFDALSEVDEEADLDNLGLTLGRNILK